MSELARSKRRKESEVTKKVQIRRLDEVTINQIAAGEVVERPASVVKELVENAIDAGATQIEVEIKNGGRQLIRVTDNGCGMEREDAVLAIERHTTSKINQADDLWQIKSLGFRGEALPSIASVSKFEIITKPHQQEHGTLVEVIGGVLKKVKDIGASSGTSVKIKDLFYNTPARLKYLKSIPTEAGHISEIITRLAIGYPEISFRLKHHQYELLFTPGNGNINDTLVAIFGQEIYRELLPLNSFDNGSGLRVSGWFGKPSVVRTNRNYEIFFINRRFFQSRTLSVAAEKAYHTLLPIARYPFIILFLEIDPRRIDVNAHPTKLEVRFDKENEVFKAVFHNVRQSLREHNLIAEWVDAPGEITNAQKGGAVTPAQNQHPPLDKQEAEMGKEKTKELAPTNLGLNYTRFENGPGNTMMVKEAMACEVGKEHPQVVPDPVTTQAQVDNYVNKPENATQQEVEKELQNNCQDCYVFPKVVKGIYIIVEDQNGLLFIDQHAAHERILYERFMKKSKETLGTQKLLIPETVTLNHSDYRLILERLSFFAGIGFELEAFGGQTIIIRGVPISLVDYNYKQVFLDLIEQYNSFETFKDPSEIKEAFIITMACRTAIKAKDKLNVLEMENLIKDLFQCDNPYTCPHGRPTVFRMSYEELAKKFLRRGQR